MTWPLAAILTAMAFMAVGAVTIAYGIWLVVSKLLKNKPTSADLRDFTGTH